MIKKFFLSLFLCFILTSPVFAVRSLPPGVQPEQIEGEAVGTFPELGGSTGKLTFMNTGGEARLVTICGDLSEESARVNSLTCQGIEASGTFTGGPDGTAVFYTDSGGVIKLQLTDGKVFSFSTQGFSMNFTVTDPSIFDDWVENDGFRDSGARASDLSGQVEIACPPDLEAWDVMKMGRVIYVDCHIKTGEDSKAVISLPDMTTFELKAESEIVIDTPPEKDSKWKLIMGNVWVNVKKMIKNGTMEVHMSQAVAGIKGTTFVMSETGSKSTIGVIEGVVSFESLATGDVVDVATGESVTATSDGLSEKTTFDSSAEQKNMQAKSNPVEKKLLKPNISNAQMPYIIGGSVAILVVLVISVVILKKRKAT